MIESKILALFDSLPLIQNSKFNDLPWVWQYWLWDFQTRGTELERFLPKNQHTQIK